MVNWGKFPERSLKQRYALLCHRSRGTNMRVSEVMTTAPVTLKASSPVSEAARAMREYDLGDVVVRKDGKLRGIVTDRDIVVRVLAEGKDPKNTSLDDICTKELIAVTPDQSASDAA